VGWKVVVAATLFPVGVVGVFVTQCVFHVQGHPSNTAIDGEAYRYRTLLIVTVTWLRREGEKTAALMKIGWVGGGLW
jgi:hypothetical protein